MSTERKENITPKGIGLFVLLTQKTNPDGTLLTARWRNIHWVNGVSLNIYSEEEAMMKRRLGIASDYKIFKTIPYEEVAEWAKKNNLQEAPREKRPPLRGSNEMFKTVINSKQPY